MKTNKLLVMSIMELSCSIQKYDWGKVGLQSKVASLFKNANPDFLVDNETPYAELWMGTHVNGPSKLKSTGESLSSVILERPEYLGENVLKKFGKDLPFLLKVLSISKALSIQVHPSKKHAEELHSKRPDVYKDPNHKPELAVALTPFEALCGFRPLSEIETFLQIIPELVEAVGSDLSQCVSCTPSDSIKNCFKALMTCRQEKIQSLLTKLLKRLSNLSEEERKTQNAELVERLHKQFPNDVGCFAVYFLNVIKLLPNEAIYLGANEPHAYLYGDCIECMACSDNVVRAGLTPKFKDVETLCSMLNYEGKPAESKLFRPIVEDEFTQVFTPPVPDFALVKLEIARGVKRYELIERNSASILLIINGTSNSEDVALIPGTAIFIPANKSVALTNASEKFLAFQAMANV